MKTRALPRRGIGDDAVPRGRRRWSIGHSSIAFPMLRRGLSQKVPLFKLPRSAPIQALVTPMRGSKMTLAIGVSIF